MMHHHRGLCAGTVNVLCLGAALAAGAGGGAALHKASRRCPALSWPGRGGRFLSAAGHLGRGGRGGREQAGPARIHGVDAREFERDLQAARRRRNVKFYNRLITKYSKLRGAAQAQTLFDDLALPPARRAGIARRREAEGSVAANDFSWSCLMNAYARCGNYARADRVLSEYLQRHDNQTACTDSSVAIMHSCVIKAYAQAGQLPAAVRRLGDLRRYLARDLGRGVRRVAGAGGAGVGEEVQRAYAAVLRGCLRCGETEVASLLYARLERDLASKGGQRVAHHVTLPFLQVCVCLPLGVEGSGWVFGMSGLV